MKSEVKTALIFGALLVVVVAGSYLYSRSLGTRDAPPSAGSPGGSDLALVAEPSEISPELRAALDAVREGRDEEARLLLEAIGPNDPGLSLALSSLGQLHWRQGNNEAALEAFRKLVILQPRNADVRATTAWAYYRLGRLVEAEIFALAAIDINPQHLGARYNLGLFRLASGSLSRAIDSYRDVMLDDPDGLHVTRALEDLLHLAQERPELADAHYGLAYFSNALGQPELEVEHLEKYLALNPSGPAVEVARARLADARKSL